MKNSLPLSQLETLAAALLDGFRAELYLTPKPGLVDLLSNGSHPDLSLLLMSRSIVLLRRYFQELCQALIAGAGFLELVPIAQRAEARMLKQLGTNSHRGGIFLAGLLLSACRRADPHDLGAYRRAIAADAELFFAWKTPSGSHGQRVRETFQVGGIVAETCQGLPAVFEVALPILLQAPAPPQAPYLAMAHLMQQVDDTTSLYRCGREGLHRVRAAGQELERRILDGADPTPWLIRLDRKFAGQNLTMGGVADLLGISFGYCSFLRQVGAGWG